MIAIYNFAWPRAWISWNESLQFESGLIRETNYYSLKRERRTHVRLLVIKHIRVRILDAENRRFGWANHLEFYRAPTIFHMRPYKVNGHPPLHHTLFPPCSFLQQRAFQSTFTSSYLTTSQSLTSVSCKQHTPTSVKSPKSRNGDA
jgi:hypothetical protein